MLEDFGEDWHKVFKIAAILGLKLEAKSLKQKVLINSIDSKRRIGIYGTTTQMKALKLDNQQNQQLEVGQFVEVDVTGFDGFTLSGIHN